MKLPLRWYSISLPVLLALLLASLPAVAKQTAAPGTPVPDCFEDWWQVQIKEIASRAEGPEALLPLRVLESLMETAADPFEIVAALSRIRADRRTHPLVAAEIDIRLLDWDLRRGDLAAADARLARLGTLRDFEISGPFARREDAQASLSAGDAGAWRAVRTGANGILPLDSLLHPSSKGFALAVFHLRAEKTIELALRFGADDRSDVWLDGRQIAAPDGMHGLAFDQHAVFFRVSKGVHRLAFIVEQDAIAWRLFARLTTPGGSRLPSTVTLGSLADLGSPLLAADTRRESRPVRGDTVATLLEKTQRRKPWIKAHLALDQGSRQLPDRESADAVALIRKLAAQWPLNREILWARALIESDAALEHKSFEKLLAFTPGHPAVLRALARYHQRYDQQDAALEYVQRGRTQCGERDPYLEGWEQISRNTPGFTMGAIAALKQITKDFPHQGALLSRLASLYAREGMLESAAPVYEQALAIDQGNSGLRSNLLKLLAMRGQKERRVELLEEAIQREPLLLSWRLQLAQSHLRASEIEAALAQIAAARALSPDDPLLRVLEGETLLAAGEESQAAKSWKAAAREGVEATDLDERLASLTGSGESFGAEWAINIDQARQILEQEEDQIEGDPPALVVSRTDAIRLRENGLATKFQQIVMSVRHPEQAAFARSFSVSYSPRLERGVVIKARLLRKDGTVIMAARHEHSLLPDTRLRMWYDTRIVQVTFPRLMEGDLLDVQFRVSSLGSANPIGDGYFGDVLVSGHTAPVLQSRIALIAPKSLPVRHKLVNFPVEATLSTKPWKAGEEQQELTLIEIPRLPAYEDAPSSPPVSRRLPYVVLGTMNDWNQLGRVYSRLIKGQLYPTTNLKELVRELTAGVHSRRQTIEALYAWVIENTRYVALEFGINAIKPYAVGSVLERRHGDCKDKAALLVAMLAEAGIDAKTTLLRSHGRGTIDTTIPVFAAFDHAIAYVPSEDLFLDCTVLHHAASELPAPDRDAMILIVDGKGEGGGWLERTPAAAPEDDTLHFDAELRLDRFGGARFKVQVDARGDYAARERAYFRLEDRPTSALVHRLRKSIVDLVIDSANFSAVDLEDDPVRYTYQGSADRFARRTESGVSSQLALILPPLPFEAPPAGREVPLWLPSPFSWRSKTIFPLEEGAQLKELPEATVVESPWGRIEVATHKGRRAVTIDVSVVFRGGEVPVADLGSFADFDRKTRQALAQRLVLGWE